MKKILLCVAVAMLALSCTPPGVLYRDGWMFDDFSGSQADTSKRRSIVFTARRYLGVPYRYGGDSPRGFDCSGFTMYVFRANSINIPRSTEKQYRSGRHISRGRLRPGDLVFFQTSRRRFSHVGIYVGNGRFIHSPRTGKRISYASLDNSYWKRRFRGAATYIYPERMASR